MEEKYDHIVETEKLSQLLLKDGESESAQLLLNTMYETFSGTELNMTMRWHIKNILKLTSISDEARTCAEQLWAEFYKAYHKWD